jgi:hypothetical protein
LNELLDPLSYKALATIVVCIAAVIWLPEVIGSFKGM